MTIIKDQINTLFSKLRSNLLVAKQNFQCCQTCAIYEIEQERQKTLTENTKHAKRIGYVFYHAQDAEFAFGEPVKSDHGYLLSTTMKDDLYLSFGSWDGDYDKNIEIGNIICKTIKDCGLVYSWNGSPDKRIIVRNRQRK